MDVKCTKYYLMYIGCTKVADMKKWLELIAVILLLSSAVLVMQSALAKETSTSMTNTSLHTSINKTGLVSFVESAMTYVQRDGKDKALKEFSNKTGSFVHGDLYIYAYDFNGTCIAHPFKSDWIGKNKMDVTDSNGVPMLKNMIDIAKGGKGYGYFIFPNPAHGNRNEFKVAYVMKVDDNWFLGSGIYLSNMSANFSQTARSNLTSFVDSAVKYANENGKDRALREFNDKNGAFFKGDLYVFAYDINGNTLALPTQPNLIGTNRINITDPNGVKIVRNMVDQAKAKEGSGFTYYIYPDPAENMTDRLKLSYIEKVDDSWWLGAGLYAQ